MSRLATRSVALLATVCLLASAPIVASAHGGAEANSLADAKAKIAAVKARIAAAESVAAGASAELADADLRLAEVEDAVNQAAAALERQEAAVAASTDRLEMLEADATRLRRAFDRRAAGIYKRGSGLPFEIVLSSGNVEDALERSAFLRVITASDTATLESITNGRIAVDAQRRLLEAERAHLEQMYRDQEALLAEVAALRATKALAAASARAEVAQLEAQKEDLEADQKELEALIARRAAPAAQVSSPSTAGYSWPLCGSVTSEFGRRWGRPHTGIDIDDNRTSAITAAKGGLVIFAGWQGGYGRMTLIDHGDGVVTAYAHQSAQVVARGDRVSRGQRIGTVGSTGNSTGPHLHFETRVSGSPVNPRRFLAGRGC